MFFSKKIRFVNKKSNPNFGFNETDINFLMDSLNISLPNIVIEFLKKAGKKSNVLDTNYNDINELVELNKRLKSKLTQNEEEDFSKIFCFYSYFDKWDKYEVFFFVKTNVKNSMVYGYSDGFRRIDIDRYEEKRIGLFQDGSFTDYINIRTWQTFGDSNFKKIINVILLIVLFPIWSIFAILILLRPRNGYTNLFKKST